MSDSHSSLFSIARRQASLCAYNSDAITTLILALYTSAIKSHTRASEITKEIAMLNNGKNEVTLSSSRFPVKS
ncbi:MAG: hypothetical protein DMF02_00625 [Verrucomicrobia bacterium]|nr:MAG: hypothetical protein DMF02_00625 [Verrucomicrobiota bacterium]